MWIFLNNSFLSIVQKEKPTRRNNRLLVRARAEGDIERVFPKAFVRCTPKADYRYRALVTRHEVGLALVKAVTEINYGNFKSSVEERDRENAYLSVWAAMMRFQDKRAGEADSEGVSLLDDDDGIDGLGGLEDNHASNWSPPSRVSRFRDL